MIWYLPFRHTNPSHHPVICLLKKNPAGELLCELWPIIQLKKTYEKISTMEIDILSLPEISGKAVF